MREQVLIKHQLRKNMIYNFITLTIIFSVLGLIIYTQVATSLYKSSDDELINNKNKIAILADENPNFSGNTSETFPPKITTSDGTDSQIVVKKRQAEDAPNPRLVYIFRDSSGNIKENIGSYNSNYFSDVDFNSSLIDEIYTTTVDGQYEYRGINYQVDNNGETSYVQVLINIDAEKTIIESFTITLIIGIVICIILSLIASYLLSKMTLKPIISSWKKQTEFVQNASHELRTPLTIIQAKQELLLEEPQSKIIDKAEDISTVLGETRRLSKLVKDLMALARADSNKMEIKKEKTDIDYLVKQVSEPFAEIAKSQNKNFELDLKYKKEINIDRNKIHQLLVILLDNAIKYTSKGEMIKITTEERDGKLALDVLDTGIGVSDQGLKHIFDRFYREDKARSRETGGSGLGLSIAHLIVDGHGGTIKAEHNNPKGTKFEIKLK